MALAEFRPAYFELDHQDDISVAKFRIQQLTDESNIEQMGQELFALVEQYARRKVVVSLESVSYLTSAALGKLITLHRKLHRQQGRLILCHLAPGVLEVLRLSRLADYFNTTETVQQAVDTLLPA